MTIPPEATPLSEVLPPAPAPALVPGPGPHLPALPTTLPTLPVVLFTPVGACGVGTGAGGAGGGGKGAAGAGGGAGQAVVVEAVAGCARLRGTLQGVAYCHRREGFGRGMQALKVCVGGRGLGGGERGRGGWPVVCGSHRVRTRCPSRCAPAAGCAGTHGLAAPLARCT